MCASIYSVDNLCKLLGQNKLQQNISLICPNLNLNQLFFGAKGDWRIPNKTISHR